MNIMNIQIVRKYSQKSSSSFSSWVLTSVFLILLIVSIFAVYLFRANSVFVDNRLNKPVHISIKATSWQVAGKSTSTKRIGINHPDGAFEVNTVKANTPASRTFGYTAFGLAQCHYIEVAKDGEIRYRFNSEWFCHILPGRS